MKSDELGITYGCRQQSQFACCNKIIGLDTNFLRTGWLSPDLGKKIGLKTKIGVRVGHVKND